MAELGKAGGHAIGGILPLGSPRPRTFETSGELEPEKTCADKVTMPAALAAYTERLFALPAVAKFKAGEKKAM